MLTEKTFDTADIKNNYTEGPDSGVPLVTLHSATARWQEMMPLITEL